jgi:Flp pilus assembly protein TadB
VDAREPRYDTPPSGWLWETVQELTRHVAALTQAVTDTREQMARLRDELQAVRRELAQRGADWPRGAVVVVTALVAVVAALLGHAIHW